MSPAPRPVTPSRLDPARFGPRLRSRGFCFCPLLLLCFMRGARRKREECWGRCVAMKGCSFMEADDPLLILIVTPCSQAPTGFGGFADRGLSEPAVQACRHQMALPSRARPNPCSRVQGRSCPGRWMESPGPKGLCRARLWEKSVKTETLTHPPT